MNLRICGPLAIAAFVTAVAPGQSRAANLTTLVSFDGTDGVSPFLAGLIADANGNLFGTTSQGGAHGDGTVFEIAKTAGGYASTPTTLVSFDGTDGAFPSGGLIADANGNLFGTTSSAGIVGIYGTVFEIAKTAGGYASVPTILYSFDGTNGAVPFSGLIANANGNLFGTTSGSGVGAYPAGTVFEIAKTASGYANTPTTLVGFNYTDGYQPLDSLIADANGNLFGTTSEGGMSRLGGIGPGTVFEIAKTASGYASTPTILYSFCAQDNCTDGANPSAGLIADANGNLFGTAQEGGAYGDGTVFEITGSGFVAFIGTPGSPNCYGQSVSALAKQYGILNAAAPVFGYSSVQDLQNAIAAYCSG